MKKRQGDWRKKVFCLLLGLVMVFSQMGFAFAETGLDLSGGAAAEPDRRTADRR